MSLRILHVLRNLEFGGMERFAADLASEQTRQGHEVGLVELLPSATERVAVPESMLLGPATAAAPVGRLARLSKVWRAAHEFGPSVLHVHNTLALSSTWLPGKLLRLPMVMTKHGMDFVPGWRGRVYRRPDFVACVSEPVHEGLLRAHPAMRARSGVVANGIPVGALPDGAARERVREQLGLPVAGDVIFWVGRLSPEKGLAAFIRAFHAALAQMSSTGRAIPTLVFVGEGKERAAIERLVAELGLAERVRLLGFRRDVRGLLPAGDMFALPSRTEGMPIALLEGMAAGLPALVTRVGAMPDIVSDEAGWIATPGDEDDLCHRLREALSLDPVARRAMGEKAREIVAGRFSIAQTAHAYEGIYRSIARA